MRPDGCTSVEREVVRAPPDALGGHRAGNKARHGLRGQRRAVDRARVPFAGGRALPKATRRAARGGTVRKCTGALGGRLTGQHAACCEYVTQRAWRTPRHRASRRARPRGAARAWRGAGGRCGQPSGLHKGAPARSSPAGSTPLGVSWASWEAPHGAASVHPRRQGVAARDAGAGGVERCHSLPAPRASSSTRLRAVRAAARRR